MNYNSEGSVSHINSVVCSFLTMLTDIFKAAGWSSQSTLRDFTIDHQTILHLEERRSAVEIPADAAADEDAPLTE